MASWIVLKMLDDDAITECFDVDNNRYLLVKPALLLHEEIEEGKDIKITTDATKMILNTFGRDLYWELSDLLNSIVNTLIESGLLEFDGKIIKVKEKLHNGNS